MKTWIFNPFKFIAGGKALMLGLALMLLTTLICFFEKIHLDGVVDVHAGREASSYIYFIEPVIDWLCLMLPLYIFGRSFSASSIRFIDMAGTSALARYPILFMVLLSIPIVSQFQTSDPQKLINTLLSNPAQITKIALMGLLIIPFFIWTIVLMYNAYSVSANLKGPKAIWSFIASFIFAEILSKVIISFLI